MTHDVNRQWRLKKRPAEQIDMETFELVEGDVPTPGPGEFLVRLCFLSLAPVMRAYVIDGGVIEKPLEIGVTMRGRGVGYVVSSRHPDYSEGDIVHGPFGWQDYAISDGAGRIVKMAHYAHSISTGLGILGLTGFTGYFGLLDKGRPQPGEAVLVSGALGGVGSVVGQLARVAGAVPVAICGSDEKCRLAVDSFGYADAINYRTQDVARRVADLFPDGIDVFFDNVGGSILEAAIDNMAFDGRIVVCGSISQYLNADGTPRGPSNYFQMVYQHVSMLGFHIYSYRDRYAEAEKRMAGWIEDGRLTHLEDRMEGMEIMPKALIGLFSGDNIGKRVVQIADEPAADAFHRAAE
jgi:NADPH-dependent curcumin reductase CurA